MPNTAKATSATPGRIIFVIDVSGSMQEKIATNERKIDVVWQALRIVLTDLSGQSTRPGSGEIAGRYLIAMFAYGSKCNDLLKGFRSISDPAARQIPVMEPGDYTYTGEAFSEVKKLLESEIPNIKPGSPAPVVCHLTDGEWNGNIDPAMVAKDIQAISVDDGNVIISNIFVKDNVLKQQIPDVRKWKGVTGVEDLSDDPTVLSLFEMSSILPESFRQYMTNDDYSIHSGARMLFPGTQPEMIYLGFAAATATGRSSAR